MSLSPTEEKPPVGRAPYGRTSKVTLLRRVEKVQFSHRIFNEQNRLLHGEGPAKRPKKRTESGP